MPWSEWSWVRDVILVGLAINYIAAGTWPALRRTLRRGARTLSQGLNDFHLNTLARRAVNLERIQRTPAVALGELLMAAIVVMLGGGYAMMMLIAALYIRIVHPASQPDLFAVLGGAALVMAGLFRAIDAQGDLLHTARKLDKLRLKAAARGWDLEDACVALR